MRFLTSRICISRLSPLSIVIPSVGFQPPSPERRVLNDTIPALSIQAAAARDLSREERIYRCNVKCVEACGMGFWHFRWMDTPKQKKCRGICSDSCGDEPDIPYTPCQTVKKTFEYCR